MAQVEVCQLAAEELRIPVEEEYLWVAVVGQGMSQEVALVGQCMSQAEDMDLAGGRLLMLDQAQAFMQIQVVDLGQGRLIQVVAWVVRKHLAEVWGALALRELAAWLPQVIGPTWAREEAVLHHHLHTSMLARALVATHKKPL